MARRRGGGAAAGVGGGFVTEVARRVSADGRTTLTLLIEAPNRAARDAIVDSGMEDGLADALDLLEQTARSLG